LNDTTLRLNSFEQRCFNNKKSGKTGSRLNKSNVQINTTKQQNQTIFVYQKF